MADWSKIEEVVFCEIWVKSLYLTIFGQSGHGENDPKMGKMSESVTSSFINQFASEFLREARRTSAGFTQKLRANLAYKRTSYNFRHFVIGVVSAVAKNGQI